MDSLKLTAEIRKDEGHKAKSLRATGQVPCVTYGHNIKSLNLQVPSLILEKVYAKAGSSTLVELEFGKEKKNVVIHDIQFDPVTDKIVHCDFYQVKMDEKIKTDVSLKYVGVSAGVKDFGGILVKAMDKLEIEALPKDLPHDIEVDISTLKQIDDTITLDQLAIPEGVEVLGLETAQVIASVTPPRSEEELDALDEEVTEDVDAVEGVKEPEEGEEVDTEGKEGKEGAAEKEGGDSAESGESAEKPAEGGSGGSDDKK